MAARATNEAEVGGACAREHGEERALTCANEGGNQRSQEDIRGHQRPIRGQSEDIRNEHGEECALTQTDGTADEGGNQRQSVCSYPNRRHRR